MTVKTKELMGAALSTEGTNSEITVKSRHLPGTPPSNMQNGSGQVSAEIFVDTINQLALNRTASSSKSRKKAKFKEPTLQSPGKRKRQPVSDTPVSPSKRTLPERGRNTVGHGYRRQLTGQLRRPSRALSNKSTDKQTMVPARNDDYAAESGSPVEDQPTPTAKIAHQSQAKVHTDKTAARSSSPAVGSGAEHENPIATDNTVDHVPKSDSGSANHTRVTPIPVKPKCRPGKQPQPTQPSASAPRSTRPGNRNLRSTARITADKPENQSRKPGSRKPAPPATAKPVREDESPNATRSADEEPDSVNGNPVNSVDGQETSGDAGPQLGSNECDAHIEENGDNDGSENENVDEQGEEVNSEAEDYIETIEDDRQHLIRSTTQFLLRGPNWDQVMEGAETVGDFKVNGVITKGKPKLETQVIKAFVEQVRIVSEIYEVAGGKGRVPPQVQELERQVEAINEDAAGNKKRRMIQDIYAHAIPELVFMLDNALDAREADCTDPERTKGLKEIIQLQRIVICLCNKARNWKEKPITDRPIKRSTQRILRYLRSMRKDYYAELQNRERIIASKEVEAAGKLDRRRREEEMRQQEIDVEEARLTNWDKIKEQLDRNEQRLFRRRASRPPHAVPPSSMDDWTVEQELVLNKGLEEFGNLPGEN